jgi:hypothetical protein
MLRLIILSTFFATFIIFACDRQKESSSEGVQHEMSIEQAKKVYYYTCPMDEHKRVHNDRFGECPECRMNLVAAVEAAPDSADFYGCPMISHSHIRHSESGKCEECNMDLKPMRLATGS